MTMPVLWYIYHSQQTRPGEDPVLLVCLCSHYQAPLINKQHLLWLPYVPLRSVPNLHILAVATLSLFDTTLVFHDLHFTDCHEVPVHRPIQITTVGNKYNMSESFRETLPSLLTKNKAVMVYIESQQ